MSVCSALNPQFHTRPTKHTQLGATHAQSNGGRRERSVKLDVGSDQGDGHLAEGLRCFSVGETDRFQGRESSFRDGAYRGDDDRAKEAVTIYTLVTLCQVGILFKVASVAPINERAFVVLSEGEGTLDIQAADLWLPLRPTWIMSGRSLEPEISRSAVESTVMEALGLTFFR